MRKQIRAALTLVFAIILVLASASAQAILKKGTRAPDFKLPSLSGKQVSLSDLRKDPTKKREKRIVLLNFWATWCPPCRKEAPSLEKLHKKYAKKGLALVGISLDSKGAKVVRPFVDKNKVTYMQLLDRKQSVWRTYKGRYVPTTYIIDRAGMIRLVQIGSGSETEKNLQKEIEALLK